MKETIDNIGKLLRKIETLQFDDFLKNYQIPRILNFDKRND